MVDYKKVNNRSYHVCESPDTKATVVMNSRPRPQRTWWRPNMTQLFPLTTSFKTFLKLIWVVTMAERNIGLETRKIIVKLGLYRKL